MLSSWLVNENVLSFLRLLIAKVLNLFRSISFNKFLIDFLMLSRLLSHSKTGEYENIPNMFCKISKFLVEKLINIRSYSTFNSSFLIHINKLFFSLLTKSLRLLPFNVNSPYLINILLYIFTPKLVNFVFNKIV